MSLTPSKQDITVVLNERVLAAEVRHAALDVPASRFGQDGLPAVTAEPLRQRDESARDILRSQNAVKSGDATSSPDTHVGRALGMSSRVVGIQVLVDVENQVGGRPVRIDDLGKSRGGSIADESLRGGICIAWQQDSL